jgi:hypothetical protein
VRDDPGPSPLIRVDGVALGIALGAVAAAWNLVSTYLDPLMEDTPLALLSFYGPIFATHGIAGFLSSRRSGRIRNGVRAGGTVAAITFVILFAAILLRINLYLDVISQRDDWRSLLARFGASGFDSFPAYANYVYVTGAPFKMLVFVAVGALFGLLGGLAGRARATCGVGSD